MNIVSRRDYENYEESNAARIETRLKLLRQHLDELQIPDDGIAYVMEVASSPPSRKVGEHRNRNLIVDVPIPHLSVVLQAESSSGEHFFLLERSRDRDLIGIYDQPKAVQVLITNRAGIKTRTTYTADYLVVHKNRVAAYEVKSDGKLQSLHTERPNDWHHEKGQYIYVPAKQHFEKLGIEHLVVPNSATSATRADNLRLLSSVRLVEDTPQLVRLRKAIEAQVRSAGVIQIGKILDALNIVDMTAIFQLVDEGILHVDLDNCLLASARLVWISCNPHHVSLMDERGFRFHKEIDACTSVSISEAPDPKHTIEIAARFAACQFIEPVDGLKSKSARTVRRYRKALKDAQGDPASLYPRWHRCGNRLRRISDVHRQLLNEVIVETKADQNQSSPAIGFREYKRRFKEMPLSDSDRCVCERTFYHLFWRKNEDPELARQRGGRRAGNASAHSIDPFRRTLLPTRSFAIAHVDHYLFDIELFLGRTPKGEPITRRPWLTAMVDAYSGEVLANWLSYKSPSRESCAMVVRDCVSRHRKLPEVLVVDGGGEFDSVHFTTLLASLNVTRIERPPEDPRFGKEVERLFGAFKESFARGLPGFVSGVSASRKTSGDHSAANRARLKFHELLELLENFTFNGYNHEPKPGEFETRSGLRATSEAILPFSGRPLSLDTRLLIQTAIPTLASCYDLFPGRGVRVYGEWYSCRALLDYDGPKKDVQVRTEPFDKSIIYACIGNRWHVCRSSSAAIHNSLPSYEVIERTAAHQPLRSYTKALAMEAQQASYELKVNAISRATNSQEDKRSKISEVQAAKKKIKGNHEKPKKNLESIGDLVMDEEAL